MINCQQSFCFFLIVLIMIFFYNWSSTSIHCISMRNLRLLSRSFNFDSELPSSCWTAVCRCLFFYAWRILEENGSKRFFIFSISLNFGKEKLLFITLIVIFSYLLDVCCVLLVSNKLISSKVIFLTFLVGTYCLSLYKRDRFFIYSKNLLLNMLVNS